MTVPDLEPHIALRNRLDHNGQRLWDMNRPIAELLIAAANEIDVLGHRLWLAKRAEVRLVGICSDLRDDLDDAKQTSRPVGKPRHKPQSQPIAPHGAVNSLHRYRPGEHGCAICGRSSTTHPNPTTNPGRSTMHQDTHRIDTVTVPPGKKAGKRCVTCGQTIWLDINRKGRQPRFCTTACKEQNHAEIRRLRAAGDLERAALLANSRTTWEQANG